MEQAFEKAMENRLFGYTQILHFYKTDGTLTSYSMHFYYLGHKEGGERFYGSANNVTELTDLKEEMELIAKYGHDNMIFIRKVYDKWVYTVASHGLSDLFNLSPKELELELNDGRFAKRIIDRNELNKFMKQVEKYAKEKKDLGDVEKVVADTFDVADDVQEEDGSVGGALAGFQTLHVVGGQFAVHLVEVFLKGDRVVGRGAVGVLESELNLIKLLLQEVVYFRQFPDGGVGERDLLFGALLG